MALITLSDVKDYLRILDDSCDSQLSLLLDSAVSYVVNHTGIKREDVLNNDDMRTAICILVSDFYWNRDYQTGNKYCNRLVDNIIENNRVNFIS